MRKISDERLVRGTLAGDREAYNGLVERYLQTVHATAFAITGNHQDAEDVAQEAFLKGLRSLDTLKKPGSFGSWIISIAKNGALSWRRKAGRELTNGGDIAQREGTTPDPARGELHDLLRAQLERMEPNAREVLLLHYFAGNSLREVAALLNISRSAAQKRLWRGREALGK